MKPFSVILALAVIVPSITRAQTVNTHGTGMYLLESCREYSTFFNPRDHRDTDDWYKVGYCDGVVKGVSDTMTDISVPSGVTIGQIELVVIKYLEDNPQILNKRDTFLIREALRKAFPKSAQ
jgi:hypothetical protein